MLRLATLAMGTRFELVLPGAPAARAASGAGEARLRAAGEQALEVIEECDRGLSLFRRDSLLAHIQRAAVLEPVALDEDTFELFEICADIHQRSCGAFDVTVAPLMRALGFHDRVGPLPSEHATIGAGGIELDRVRRTIRLRASLALDLGAIAKGHALELAARTLREAGVQSALLHGGTSSVVAIGAPPGLDAWRVAVEGGPQAPIVELRDGALSVSAQHGRRLSNGAGHVLDPRTQRSAATSDVVAVAHADARWAEGWSTALLVLGEIPAAARDLDVAVGRGERFDRAWSFSRRERAGSHFRFTAELVPTP